jgi:hypothetical protein
MRSRVSLILVAGAALVIAICELESVAAVNRWDPSDLGRAASLSCYLLPDSPPEDEHALVTVRVQAGADVRTYRYWIAPEEEDFDHMLEPEAIEEDAGAAGLDDDTVQDLVAAAR